MTWASSRLASGPVFSRWSAMRSALRLPMPGSFPNCTMRFWTGFGYSTVTPLLAGLHAQPRNVHPCRDLAHLVGLRLLGDFQRIGDRAQHQVLEHLRLTR